MPPQKPPLTLIVATTPVPARPSSTPTTTSTTNDPTRLGIGQKGTLPWPRIKTDLSFFARVTTRPPAPGKVNAVVMGRKTYFSIPGGLRPLRGRVNVVVSRDQHNQGLEGEGSGKISEQVQRELEKKKSTLLSKSTSTPQNETPTPAKTKEAVNNTDAFVSPNLESALSTLDESYGNLDHGGRDRGRLGRIYVIGGAEIYASALRITGRVVRIVMTNVLRRVPATGTATGTGTEASIGNEDGTETGDGDVGFECDTFFPLDGFDQAGWRTASAEEVSEWVGETVTGKWRDEGEVSVQMVGYERS